VSLRQTANSKHGKLSKAPRPGLRNDDDNSLQEVFRSTQKERKLSHNIKRNATHQKIDLKISSKGIEVRGKKSSCTKKMITGSFTQKEAQ